MNNLLLYVVYHDDESFKICYDLLYKYPWIRFEKIETTKYCESIFFKFLLDHYDDWKLYDFVGMITYSFSSKIPLETLLDAYKNISENKFNEYDIIALRKLKYKIGDHSQIGISKHLVEIMNKVLLNNVSKSLCSCDQMTSPRSNILNIVNTPDNIIRSISSRDIIKASYRKTPITPPKLPTLDKLSLDISDIDKIVPFYSNYWICKPSVLKSFLLWAKEVKDIMDSDTNINENSYYKANSPSFIPIFNRPFMTWHPFLMERMICIYAYLVKARLYTYESTMKVTNDKKRFGKFVCK